MLLRRRAPGIEHRPATTRKGFEHLDAGWIAVLRWLNANQVDYVLVGAPAEAIRGHSQAKGPVAIVPAPYRRNFARLERALAAAHARQRAEHAGAGEPDTVPVKVTADKLGRGLRWLLRCDSHDLDIETIAGSQGADTGHGPGYQELLYEATRFELAEGVSVEVASPEDIEHYSHVARTGTAPKMRITRAARAEPPAGEPPDATPDREPAVGPEASSQRPHPDAG
jgi:hypothetical protein